VEGTIIVSSRELHRARVFEEVRGGRMTLMRAADYLGVSYRQAKRLKSRYDRDDVAGLVHGNRGKLAGNAISEVLRERVLWLHENRYKKANDTHFTELLAEREQILMGRETIRKLLRGAGKPPKRRRRARRHHGRRQPMERMGMLVQMDGSPHHWFGPDHPPCCLMAAVDDAGKHLLAALFVPVECSEAYLRLLAMLLTRHGIPAAAYHDRHSSLVRTDNCWSREEELQGFQFPTHVGRVLAELGIQSIPASSPQAKGRVERSFGVLQDRLLVELDLEGITDIDTANAWLESAFIDRYNARFSKEPQDGESAFTAISPDDIHHHVAFAYEATVGNDNAVRLGGITIDIPPGPKKRSYAKSLVLVRQHLDGSWTVTFEKQIIATCPPTPFREPVRSWKPRHAHHHDSGNSCLQVYIASKPAPPSRGQIPLAVRGTY
jgi:transposase